MSFLRLAFSRNQFGDFDRKSTFRAMTSCSAIHGFVDCFLAIRLFAQ